MSRVLITGGAGFIGSHFCEELLKRENEVLCLDNCYTGPKANVARIINTYGPRMNLVDGLVRLMDSGDDFIGPVNLGNPGEFTVLELAHKVLEQTGSKLELFNYSLPEDDPRQRRPDVILAQQKLGWQATTPLDEGLSRTIEDFRARLEKV